MSMRSSYSYADFEADEKLLFNHLQLVRQAESCSQLIDRYRHLFIHGSGYQKHEIQQAVHRLANCRWADRRFSAILNRCCYILINYWSYLPNGGEATERLIALFQETPRANDAASVQRLHELVQQFVQSSQHQVLQRRASASKNLHDTKQNRKTRPLRELISRFPPLYPHYLLEFDSSEGGRDAVHQHQQNREQEIEEMLWRYGLRKMSGHRHRSQTLPENPTLLDTAEVDRALRHFSYEGVGAMSYHEAARQLVLRSHQLPNHRAFKAQLHQELCAFATQAFRMHNPHSRPDYDYADHHFGRWLHQQLQTALPQHDNQPPNVSLRVQTCTHLLDVLLEPPRDRIDGHVKLLDLTANLGTMLTVGLLLKIVLVCHNGNSPLASEAGIDPNLDAIRSHLAERFAALFREYEMQDSQGVNWLVECLEHWMIVASIHFGKHGVSYWSAMLRGN
ncbi:hypothetical protein H6F67_19315 [Microcoleus sp. FACHB-1515]|uniref:hypothetical protein n=1 Tax=Cyanophyceae TaxID=3028117 RepID=UPI0016894D03|nr:hypothetical protein [Microcoleus sp. FACHB-1515]MBD2092000.1 hypothetical protein [Microcoleus sp. FACHB-1515]